MKDQAPPHLALLFVCGFTVILLHGGLGVEDQSLHQVPIWLLVISYRGLHKTGNLPIETEDTWWNEQQIPDAFTVVPLDFFGKRFKSVSSRLQQCVHHDWAYVEISHWILVHGLYEGASLVTIQHSVCIVTSDIKYLRHKLHWCPHTTLTTLMYLPWPSYGSKTPRSVSPLLTNLDPPPLWPSVTHTSFII
jgi:hypothetical protein